MYSQQTRLQRARFIGPPHVEVLGSDVGKERGTPRRWIAVNGEVYSSIHPSKKQAIKVCVRNYLRFCVAGGIGGDRGWR